eukprot:CAMPEP_0119084192 /NCGR_PEP_ID=MMETSP1178-20130426/128671_1 /TAXON_ID=33656 /ORGANISM="unid sp, Strain CCMP2000" /LENGTH=289 /DNA_ID=CAMNT_0007067135 /DNA_START=34 /DNA_END=903 /DNA_ORIENTATION=+
MADEVKLFVGGLPDDCSEDDLRVLFSPHGFVREAVILPSKSKSGQKCGFVCYRTRTAQEMASAAIATLNNLHCPPGVDKPIQVSVAKNSTAVRTSYPGGPPQPLQPPMGLPGALGGGGITYGGLGVSASPMAVPGLPGQPHGWAPGLDTVGMGGAPPWNAAGMGGAPPWAQLTPTGPPTVQPNPDGQPTVQPNPDDPPQPPIKLFVGSLPGGATTTSVQQIFQPFGHIHEIHLMEPSAKTGDRCAFVSFLTAAAAQSAVEQLNGRFQVPPSPRTIVVQLAKESNKRPRV